MNELQRQRAVLVAIDIGEYDVEISLNELEELADTAGADTIGKLTQNRDSADRATYIGGGKLHEIKSFCEDHEIELVIFDGELSGSQLRNIEEVLEIDVVDRTMLILDIFAQRATSSEGKLQVELAQQKYLLPRLIGVGKALSRQGGGIGTRGPGETKLESDRRHIRSRITAMEAELKELEKRRTLMRRKREKNEIPTIAIVGYTNVGKSSLLNLLTGSEIYVQDQLFATLDPTAREIVLPDGQHAIIIDTVGLIQRLPHQLVEAFKSTLEVAAQADLILNVCDYANPLSSEQLAVTRSLLDELGCGGIPTLTVFNKIDLVEDAPSAARSGNHVYISVRENKGTDYLLTAVAETLADSMRKLTVKLPYSAGSLADRIRKQGKILEEAYEEDGILMKIIVNIRLLKELAPFTI